MLLKIQWLGLKKNKNSVPVNSCHFLNFIFAANTVLHTVKTTTLSLVKVVCFFLISNFAVLFVFFRTTVRLMDQHTFHLHLIQYGKGKALYEFPSLFLTTFPENGLIDLVNVWIYTTVKWYFQGSPCFNISEDLILLAPVLQ